MILNNSIGVALVSDTQKRSKFVVMLMQNENNQNNDDQINKAETYKTYVKTSAVGLEFGLAIIVGAGGGYLIDKYFQTSPYGLIIGALIGSLAAAKTLWRFSKKYLAENKKNDE